MDEGKSPVKLPILGATAAPSDDGVSRRRFLALFGASAAVATGAGCKMAKSRSTVVPYTKKQEEVVPGIADYYASTFQEGEQVYPVLVKAREGRPILVEGNDEHPLYQGKTHFHAMADLLGLYDPDRLRSPLLNGRSCSWKEAVAELGRAVKGAGGKPVLLMTPAVLSPTRKALLATLAQAIPGLRHVPWEPAADHVGRQVQKQLYGEIRQPRYAFDKAKVIVSFAADFLGTDGDTVSASKQFAAGRRPQGPGEAMNRLYALEGGVTLTGSKADVRLAVPPSSLGRLALGIARAVQQKKGATLPSGTDPTMLDAYALDRLPEARPMAAKLEALVSDLCAASDKALVLAGPTAPAEAHAACHLLNQLLGTGGSTVLESEALPAATLATPDELKTALDDLAAGKFAVAVFWDVNPAYDAVGMSAADATNGEAAWNAALSKTPLRVRMGLLPDETAAGCNLVLPVNHWLESWNDFEPTADTLTLQQPVVEPLYDTLAGEDILLRLLVELGHNVARNYHELVQGRWEHEVQPQSSPIPFAQFWNACLHDGMFRRKPAAMSARTLDGKALAGLVAGAGHGKSAAAFELVLTTDARLYDGRYANNGWLQEMPDPVTKIAWLNPLAISVADAARLGVKDGDLVRIGNGPAAPVMVQPGQADGVLALTIGHGRWQGSVASAIGTRAWDFAGKTAERLISVASVTPTGGRVELPAAQGHDMQAGRDIARTWTLAEYARKAERGEAHEELPTLYEPHEHKAARWGMAIDLSSCVGCGACVIGCQSENNVPVVGPEQVAKGRAMHWMRVDRYYDSEPGDFQVVHEPMLCQHCDDAPCETVCPVNATTHAADGINQMAYNRCVGTRYCANNCPYKVRRFNFLDFTGETPESLQLAFNPEVTVRPRGVMEKCTFCVQRIRNAEQVAKRESRGLRDHDVVTACQSACPTSAIVFGDLNDPKSEASKLSRSNRGYRVLEELGTKPAVTYLASLRNLPGRGTR
jgi:Fe-S-cluster-containing dehydrogenase component